MARYIDADAIHYVEIGKGVEIALASDIDKIPTISPDEVRGVVCGTWLDHQEGRWVYAKCSRCETVHDVKYNYCPSCGARMTRAEAEKAMEVSEDA